MSISMEEKKKIEEQAKKEGLVVKTIRREMTGSALKNNLKKDSKKEN